MARTTLCVLRETLERSIDELTICRQLFSINPGTNFTRDRKIPFKKLIHYLISMQSGCLTNELQAFYQYKCDTPTASAFLQQRDKFLSEGMKYLLQTFNQACIRFQAKRYRGYRLLACDGTDINLPLNPKCDQTYIHQREKGYNQTCLVALYDILNRVYVDSEIEGRININERSALIKMADRYPRETPAIYIADRGFSSFAVFTHLIREKRLFVIRVKDINVQSGFLKKHHLPDIEFDQEFHTIITDRHNQVTLGHSDQYTILSPGVNSDFLGETRYFHLSMRIVRFAIGDGQYETIATNLSQEDFPMLDIKALYRMRWGEETAFRKLKYTIALSSFHSKKTNAIEQEIYARLLLYNFCEMAVASIPLPMPKKATFAKQINFVTAVNACRAFLIYRCDVFSAIALIRKNLTPIRLGRSFKRYIRPKQSRPFGYRPA